MLLLEQCSAALQILTPFCPPIPTKSSSARYLVQKYWSVFFMVPKVVSGRFIPQNDTVKAVIIHFRAAQAPSSFEVSSPSYISSKSGAKTL